MEGVLWRFQSSGNHNLTEMNVKYKHVMCRLCLCKSGIMTDVHSCRLGNGFLAATVITNLLQLQVSATDCYPQLICLECLSKLNDFQRFKDSCWQAKVNFDTQYSYPPFNDVYGPGVECGGRLTNMVTQGDIMETVEEYSKPCTEEDVDEKNFHSEITIKEEAVGESDVKDPLSLESPYSNVGGKSKEDITIKDEEIQMNERLTVERAPVTFMERTAQITLSQAISNQFKNITVGKDPPEFKNTLNSTVAQNGENFLNGKLMGKEGDNLIRNGISIGENAVNGIAVEKEGNNLIRNGINVEENEGKIPTVQYFCKKCCKIFTSMCDLVNHNCAKHSVINFECKVCGEKFKTEEILWSHMQKHNLSMRFYCQICGIGFLREEYLSIHFSSHVNNFPIQPDVSSNLVTSIPLGDNLSDTGQSNCDLSKVVPNDNITASTEKKKVESKLQESKSGNICPLCGGVFSSLYTLEKHIFLKHPDKYLEYTPVHKKIPTKKDLECSEKKEKENGLGKPKSENICPICCGKFYSVVTLKRHMIHQHTEKNFECKICHKKFRNQELVECHARLHRENRPFQCEICGAGFFKEEFLSRHVSCHARDDPFLCDRCGKTYHHKRPLWRHIARCYKTKWYECDICNKKFSTKSYISVHKLVHTGEKNLMCEVCGKTFREANTLLIHKRQHTGEKPYCCDICDRRFTQRVSFTQHIKRYHE